MILLQSSSKLIRSKISLIHLVEDQADTELDLVQPAVIMILSWATTDHCLMTWMISTFCLEASWAYQRGQEGQDPTPRTIAIILAVAPHIQLPPLTEDDSDQQLLPF